MSSKEFIRKRIIDLRNAISPSVKTLKDAAISSRIISAEQFRRAESVLLYAAFGSEINTAEIIRRSVEAGKTIAFPVVVRKTRELRLFSIRSESELKPGYMGIPEPSTSNTEVQLGDIELVLLPGVAFDLKCRRIGYGGGYYDKMLGAVTAKPFLLAAAYEEQIIESVPTEPHDIRVDMIVTEERIITYGND